MGIFSKHHGHHDPAKINLSADAVMLFADLQEGIIDLPLTIEAQRLRMSVTAMCKLAKIFELPVIVTTVPGHDGGAAKIMPVIGDVLGKVAPHQRTKPPSFANDSILQAMQATGRKTVIIAGVAMEVAVQFAALSALERGFHAHVIVDACGGLSPRTEDAALRRMMAAGVTISSVPALAGELAGDFSQPRGQAAIGVLFEMANGS